MPKTILIVDDNELLRTSLSFLLTSNVADITVAEAGNAEEAIESAKTNPPDLIVLDIAMPGMNGLFAAPNLRKLAPKAAILLFSLYAAEVRAPHQFGVDAIVSKAQGADTFLNTVRELLATTTSAEPPTLADRLPMAPAI
jgi:DNA-binding NarL/FixJ family response regulator